MRVAVSVYGRFHAFRLAAQLAARDALAGLHTSYPRATAVGDGVPAELVDAAPLHEILNRASQKVRGLDPRALACSVFERRAARRLPADADVFVGWSGSSLAALRRARSLGMMAVVERGSSHIEHQRDVMRAEYARQGIAGGLPHPRTVEKELAEYEEADRIMVPTAFARRTFLERGVPAEKVLQVPYGVSLSEFAPPAEERDPAAPFTILQVGNVSFRKGAHHLVRAFRELDLPAARLDFVGPVAAEVRPFLDGWSGGGVRFHGRVPQAELSAHYARASVFVLASLEEGMAMVVPQAMACGLPVVATEATGAGEVVREGREGHLVPAGDLELLKERLRALHDDPATRLAQGRAAAARVAEGFTWNDYGRRVHITYRDALLRHRTASARTHRAA